MEIIGENEKLYRCSCCGYLTMNSIGEYDICRLCGWEDDGTIAYEMNKFSQVNGSDLHDYKNNFEKKLDEIDVIFDK